jgi:hypothetical protein
MDKLKNKDLILMNEALMYLSSKQTSAWFGVSKNIRAIKPHIEEINASKEDIIANLSQKDSEGKPMYVGDGQERRVVWTDEAEADKVWKELMETPAAKIKWTSISEAKFGDVELDSFVVESLMDIVIVD